MNVVKLKSLKKPHMLNFLLLFLNENRHLIILLFVPIGSVTKDVCNCCEECMKQENEICGGINHRFGKCDHHVRFCEKLPGRSQKRCMTQVTGMFTTYSSNILNFVFNSVFKPKNYEVSAHRIISIVQNENKDSEEAFITLLLITFKISSVLGKSSKLVDIASDL